MTALSRNELLAGETPARRPEFEIRKGVTFPKWDAVRSEAAATALLAMLEVVDVGRRWTGHKPAEDRVYRAILTHYARHALAPSIKQLSEMSGMGLAKLRASLRDLDERDLIVVDEGRDAITGAYPFTDRETDHCVTVDGRSVYAMCAVDALGAPAMVGWDAVIESRCRACDTQIRVGIRDEGVTLTPSVPQDAVVWLDLRRTNGCSATSLCAGTAVFCSDAHLHSWREAHERTGRGHRLSIAEAHQVGVAIFSPRLTPPAPNP